MTRITTRAQLDEALRRVLLESIADEPAAEPEAAADHRTGRMTRAGDDRRHWRSTATGSSVRDGNRRHQGVSQWLTSSDGISE